MGTQAPIKLYMAQSFSGLLELAAYKLDRSKPVQDHLGLVDRMLVGVREAHAQGNEEKIFILLFRIIDVLATLNQHKDPKYKKVFEQALEKAEKLRVRLKSRYEELAPPSPSREAVGAAALQDVTNTAQPASPAMDRELGFMSGEVAPLPAALDTVYTIDTYSLEQLLRAGQRSVLVVDTRPQQEHAKTPMVAPAVVHIPEEFVSNQENVTVDAIQAYLKDPAAARLWQDRAQFDDIVLFDRASTRDDVKDTWRNPLAQVMLAMSADRTPRAVRGTPRMLNGGFKEMSKTYPDRFRLPFSEEDVSSISFPALPGDLSQALQQTTLSGAAAVQAFPSIYPTLPSNLDSLQTAAVPDVGECVQYTDDDEADAGPDLLLPMPMPPEVDRRAKPMSDHVVPERPVTAKPGLGPPDRPVAPKPQGLGLPPTGPPGLFMATSSTARPTQPKPGFPAVIPDSLLPPAPTPLPVFARGAGLTGLRNLGNTCYMNSVIQCLSNAMPFSTHFIDQRYLKEINKDNPLGMGGVLAREFGKLVNVLWREQYKYVAPSSLKNTISRFAPRFAGYDQHDAQELLAFLMDGLHEDLNRSRDRKYVEDPDYSGGDDYRAAAISWENYRRRNNSVVVDLFQGQLRSELKCLTCGYISITFNTFMYLSLPLPGGKKSLSLDDAIREFTAREVVTGEDRWYCRKCKRHRDAEKKLDIWRMPVILIVHIKRFNNMHVKNEAVVDFPIASAELGRFASGRGQANGTYHLSGIVNHWGKMGSGHYTAYCRNMYDKKWYDFDDTTVKAMPDSKLKTAGAYFLTYIAATHMKL